MKINKLIKHLERMRDEHNVHTVRIPRLGYAGCYDIDDDEFSEQWIVNGVLAIEGQYDHENSVPIRSN